ncbi:MAG TPA: iron-containing alcohol dehydrogenase [Desulfobulbus sp.]|nr:iron-containing alcohol dehydrogenase [Desulfobulbus sp.]
MQNFVYHNPTKIIFGRNTISAIGSETALWGRHALLVYGKTSSKQSGLYDQVTHALAGAGVSVTEHGGVRSNPTLGHVRSGIRKAKERGCDVIVAMGGGSVIDSAKAISAGTVVDHDVWKFFIGKKSIKNTLPVTTVLTIAAAGSEMNSGMVITNEETREKFGFGNKRLFPKVSILDPEITFTVPADYTAYGAVDAISHVLEFYMTTQDPATPVQDRLMEGLIENSMDACNRCLQNLKDYAARADLMWTATLALNGLTAAGLGRVGFPMHMIEHSLSALYDIAHGAGLSIIIPGWLSWFSLQNPERVARLGRRVFGRSIIGGQSAQQQAQETCIALKKWFDSVHSPTSLSAMGIVETDLPAIAENALKLAKVWRLSAYNRERIIEILRRCL